MQVVKEGTAWSEDEAGMLSMDWNLLSSTVMGIIVVSSRRVIVRIEQSNVCKNLDSANAVSI